jgi:ribosomal protein L37AE/L43A
MLTPAAADRLRTQLAQIPELLTYAHLALLPGAAPQGGRVSGGSTEAPLPLRLDVLDLLGPRHDDEPGPDLLASWAETVIADRQRANDWTGWVRVPYTLTRERSASLAVRYLLLHHPFAITRPYARDYAAEIGALHRALDRTAGRPIPHARPARMACPHCQMITVMERTDGIRECINCRAEMSPAEHQGLAEQILAENAAA